MDQNQNSMGAQYSGKMKSIQTLDTCVLLVIPIEVLNIDKPLNPAKSLFLCK